jgi:hypothetical protein
VRLIHFLEPTRAIPEHAGVFRFVNVIAKRLDRLPDGHVDDHQWVVAVDNVRRVSGSRLEPPDKPGRAVCKGVDGVKLGYKIGNFRIVNRRGKAA